MILDLDRFQQNGRAAWDELAALLDRLENRPGSHLELAEAEALETLYHRAAADLNRLQRGARADALRAHLRGLVARAYAQIYAAAPPRLAQREHGRRILAALQRFARDLPRAVRRQRRLLALAAAVMAAGVLFGALAVTFDPAAVPALLPADYLSHPGTRVQHDLSPSAVQPGIGVEAAFSAQLITHNILVSLFTAALGLTAGLGTGLMLFVNGVMVGAVAARYAESGFGVFVAAWLLPHGAFEIPSLLIAGQAGFLLARILLAGGAEPRWRRIRRQTPDFLLLLGGLCCLLVWAGLMEAFVSQHHGSGWAAAGPIAAGLTELALLSAYFGLAGRATTGEAR